MRFLKRIKQWWLEPTETDILINQLEKLKKSIEMRHKNRLVIHRHASTITLEPGEEVTLYDSFNTHL